MSTLYIVATPIGNLRDITLRALDILRGVDVIACEDTRHTRKLLTSHDIRKTLMSCHANAEEKSAGKIIELLSAGKSVAYASDAGTPGLSDPGAVLVRRVRDAGFDVVPVPGPSAVTALLSVAGIPGKGFYFEGFLSPKRGRRRRRIEELVALEEPFVLYESPFRIIKLFTDLADMCSQRPVLIGREITKMHEEFIEGTCEAVYEKLVKNAENGRNLRGEFCVLVGRQKKG
jgi:16S rRNA (cytidine1402-2'-O)-methyltransferase